MDNDNTSGPDPKKDKNAGPGRTIIAVIVSIIFIVAVLSIIMFTGIIDKDDGDSDDENGEDDKNGDDNGDDDGGGDNGDGDSNGKDMIKVITAMDGKKKADEIAHSWDSHPDLQKVRGYEGDPSKIYLDGYEWVDEYDVNTIDDNQTGDGKCTAWEYEYFPVYGDIYSRLHVLVFANGSSIKWEERLEGSASNDSLSGWQLDSDSAASIAKTLGLYNNLSSDHSNDKYTFYELRPGLWEITLNDISEYTRIQIDEPTGEIIYHYP